jgi:glycosyltransferase involved in cell wall biosynthesis
MTLLQDRAVMSPTDPAAKVMFLFVGGGAKRAKLEREAMRRTLTNFRIRPNQPKERLSETLGVGDVHLVSLDPRLEGLIVPSKFYGIAAAGRPTIFIGSLIGEIARILAHYRCGYAVSPGDGDALVDRILELASDRELCSAMGARAREACSDALATRRRRFRLHHWWHSRIDLCGSSMMPARCRGRNWSTWRLKKASSPTPKKRCRECTLCS